MVCRAVLKLVLCDPWHISKYTKLLILSWSRKSCSYAAFKEQRYFRAAPPKCERWDCVFSFSSYENHMPNMSPLKASSGCEK